MKCNLILFTMSLLLTSFLMANAPAKGPNKAAPQGGNFNFNLRAEPPTIHPITSNDVPSREVKDYICDRLARRSDETYEYEPRLAERWEIGKDNKTFTFYLRKDAVFHNGEPVTAEDVKFSFEAIMDPRYEAFNLKSYLDNVIKVEVLDPHTVKFTTKDVYFKDFESITDLIEVIPKSVYSNFEKSKAMTREVVCAGPYVVEKFDRGQLLRLKRFKDWYGNKQDHLKGLFNFETVTFRFFKEENIALERLKRGDVDFSLLQPEAFVRQTKTAPWGKSVFAVKVENKMPKAYSFIGWNFKNPLFSDVQVRRALTHLANRAEMNKRFRFDLSHVAQTAINPESIYYPKDLKPIEYDPKKALELLTKAGWADTDKDGILDKVIDGQKTKFSFKVAYSVRDPWEKYMLFYQEDLKRVGIDLQLNYMEWNSFQKILDDFKFDAIAMAWGKGDVDPDPKQIWHSSNAVTGGSNFISYKDPQVDRWIDQARIEVNREKRIQLLQQVYKKLGEDAPYLFLNMQRYHTYARSNKVASPHETFQYELGYTSWHRAAK